MLNHEVDEAALFDEHVGVAHDGGIDLRGADGKSVAAAVEAVVVDGGGDGIGRHSASGTSQNVDHCLLEAHLSV